MGPNSYGFNNADTPDSKFGIYDTANGEWVGVFYDSESDAEAAMQGMDTIVYCVESTDEE